MIKIPQIGDVVMSPHSKVKDGLGVDKFDLLECNGIEVNKGLYPLITGLLPQIRGPVQILSPLVSAYDPLIVDTNPTNGIIRSLIGVPVFNADSVDLMTSGKGIMYTNLPLTMEEDWTISIIDRKVSGGNGIQGRLALYINDVLEINLVSGLTNQFGFRAYLADNTHDRVLGGIGTIRSDAAPWIWALSFDSVNQALTAYVIETDTGAVRANLTRSSSSIPLGTITVGIGFEEGFSSWFFGGEASDFSVFNRQMEPIDFFENGYFTPDIAPKDARIPYKMVADLTV